MCVVFIPQSAMSKPKELDFILLFPLRLWYITRWEPECLCVCIIDEGLCSHERNDDMYAFIFWVGGSGFLFVLLGDVYVLAHLCSKCLQTWTLWLYSSFLPVTAGGTAYQDTWPHGLPCPSHEGTQSCNFCSGFILGLDKSLFVWK